MSPPPAPRRLDVMRTGVAAVSVFDVATLLVRTLFPNGRPARPDPPQPFLFLGQHAWTLVPLALVTIFAIARFARARDPVRWGLIALALRAVVAECNVAVTGQIAAEWHVSGLCLGGWIAGVAYAQYAHDASARGDDPVSRRFAEAGVTTGVVAMYVAAGVSKVLRAGFAWSRPEMIWHVAYASIRVDGDDVRSRLALALIEHPWLARASSTATLVVETGAFMMLVSRRWRQAVCLALIAMHMSFYAFVRLSAPQTVAMCLLLAFDWQAILARRRGEAVEPLADPPLDAARARSLLSTLALAWVALTLLAWALPIRDYLKERPELRMPWEHHPDDDAREGR